MLFFYAGEAHGLVLGEAYDLFLRAKPAVSQLTQPSRTVREGFDPPPAPSLSREGSN